MYATPQSPTPATFHVRASGSDVAGLFGGEPRTADHGESPDTLNLYDTVCVWWGHWVAVAATGWGALVLLVPLVAAYVARVLHLSWARR